VLRTTPAAGEGFSIAVEFAEPEAGLLAICQLTSQETNRA